MLSKKDWGKILSPGMPPATWKTKGFIEYQDSLYIYGPFIPFRTAGQVLEERNFPLLLSALSIIPPDNPLHLKTLLLADTGELMMLSPSITQQLLKLQPIEQRILDYERWGGNSFLAMGVLSYYFLTGRYPYSSENIEDIHESMQKGQYVSLSVFRDDIPPSASSLINRSLHSQTASPPSMTDMDQWQNLLPQLITLADTSPSPENILAAEREQKRLSQRSAMKKFWKKRGILIGSISLISILVLGIAASIITGALRLDYNVDKTPAEVVQLYFDSINELNVRGLMESLDSGVGKDIIREVSTLHTILKVRSAYEGQLQSTTPPQWMADPGKTTSSESIYGINHLQIVERDSLFIVSYQRWISLPDESGRVQPQGLQISERFHLEWKKNRWIISEINLLSQEPISLTEEALP